MWRNKRFWIALLVLVAIGGTAGYLAYNNNVASAAQDGAGQAQVQTATVRRGNIVVSATGAGTVLAAQEIELSFDTGGLLTEIAVQLGQTVTAGDVLARVDDTAAQEALADAQLQLQRARMQSDASATEAGISFDDISVQQAQLDLQNAQESLEELLNWEPDEDEIALAEAQLDAAEASYSAAVGQQSSAILSAEQAKISLAQAQRDLAAAQEAYDNAWDEARDWETFYKEPICDTGEREPCTGQTWAERIARDRDSTANGLQRAQESLTNAELNYQKAVASSASGSPASAQTSILSAQLALEEAQNGPTDEEIAAAESALQQAELALQQARLNQEANALDLIQAEMNLESAQEALEATTLRAPIDGTVMAINGDVGERVSNTALIVLADLTRPMLELFVDETDLDRVGLDYEVDVTFDALPDEVFTGRVVQVDPQLTQESGVSAVRALVEIDYSKPQPLPVGLNATVDVIGGRAENALIVPVEALREISSGQYALFVMENGEPRLRNVEVGLMDFTFAEITSGVQEGDVVTTGIVQTES